MSRWQPISDADERMRSAIAACRFATSSPDLIESQRRKIISDSLWLVTEGTPARKYQTRYRSEGALHISDPKQLAHEHVWTRKIAVHTMLADPDSIESMLAQAIGCVVTRDEHLALGRVSKSLDGWRRYKAAGLIVHDMSTEEPADLDELIQEAEHERR